MVLGGDDERGLAHAEAHAQDVGDRVGKKVDALVELNEVPSSRMTEELAACFDEVGTESVRFSSWIEAKGAVFEAYLCVGRTL
jgi:hypothetical protein